MKLFETETMAELCIKQGHPAQGLAIYRRLLEEAADVETRARRQRRIAELEALGTQAEATEPGSSAGEPTLRGQLRGDELEVEWTLPPDTREPALQLLLMTRPSPAAGIETETRTVRLDAPSGRMTVGAPGLYAARAAVGFLDREGTHFVPLARLPDGAL